jgi:hypothetical protein
LRVIFLPSISVPRSVSRGLSKPPPFPSTCGSFSSGILRSSTACYFFLARNFDKVMASRARAPSFPPALDASAIFPFGMFFPTFAPSRFRNAQGCLIASLIQFFFSIRIKTVNVNRVNYTPKRGKSILYH